MSVNWGDNATCLGYDLLFILLWVAVWNSADIIVNHYVKTDRKKLWLYLALLALMIIVLILVNRGCSGTVG